MTAGRTTHPLPPPGSALDGTTFLYGGIDVGGTKIHAIVTDEAGAVLGEHTVPTGQGPDEVVAGAVTALHAAADSVASPGRLRSVGVGIPGHVDPVSGIVSHAVNLGVVELRLGEELSSRLGVPVAVDNDVKAAALGAARHFGVHEEPLSYLNFGTGLAMATVHAGQIWRGNAGFAGEIGHLAVSGSGITCTCGQIGCLETVASGNGMLRRWQAHRPSSTAADLDERRTPAIRSPSGSGTTPCAARRRRSRSPCSPSTPLLSRSAAASRTADETWSDR